MSTNFPHPPADQSVSEATKIRQPRSQTSTNIPTNTAPKGSIAGVTPPKGSANPSKAETPANLKSTFGIPKKQK